MTECFYCDGCGEVEYDCDECGGYGLSKENVGLNKYEEGCYECEGIGLVLGECYECEGTGELEE